MTTFHCTYILDIVLTFFDYKMVERMGPSWNLHFVEYYLRVNVYYQFLDAPYSCHPLSMHGH